MTRARFSGPTVPSIAFDFAKWKAACTFETHISAFWLFLRLSPACPASAKTNDVSCRSKLLDLRPLIYMVNDMKGHLIFLQAQLRHDLVLDKPAVSDHQLCLH